MEYAQFVLGGEIEHYLSLSCDYSRFCKIVEKKFCIFFIRTTLPHY
ncbi:hypothetical protein [Faecalibacterium wellingii]|uniref:Uncharacterized protein n=1 Tax=Faecalibacterium wellingii TaxID=2929491 RepID=A0ABU3TWC6_9FIRM|nr:MULTISPECIES: hypothetical protein [Faecalibacterium]MDU8687604.1 hypothetical protein [Faecalibacterium prausnitzii]